MNITLIGLFLSGVAMAQNEGVTQALKTDLKKGSFSATLQTGFHFNDKAPNQLKIDEKRVQPSELKKQSITFKIPAGEYSAAQASLYICDDANTFCEPRQILLKGSSNGGASEKSLAPAKKNSHGFLEISLEEAQELAKGKLILVDFSARWCPGCVRLEQEVFETKDFKTASKNLVKVKLDVDRFENIPTKKEYAVSAIPTLIVLNSELEEISRIVDYQPPSVIKTFLDLAVATPLTFAELKPKAEAGDSEASLILGRRQYNAGQFAEAAKYLEKVSPAPIELLDAKAQAAKLKGEIRNYQMVLREALSKESSSSRSLLWRAALANTLKSGDAERKKLAQEGLAIADSILADDQKTKIAVEGDLVGEFAGIEKLLVGFHRVELAQAGELGEQEVANANSKAAEIAKSLKIPISKTGPSMRYLLALVGAKDWKAAEVQARKLLSRDPKNPELQRRLLRVLNEVGNHSEAVKVGKSALAGSYGKNEIWVVQQLAKAYAGADQRLEARALIQSYLNRSDIDWSLNKSEKEDLESQRNRLAVQ